MKVRVRVRPPKINRRQPLLCVDCGCPVVGVSVEAVQGTRCKLCNRRFYATAGGPNAFYNNKLNRFRFGYELTKCYLCGGKALWHDRGKGFCEVHKAEAVRRRQGNIDGYLARILRVDKTDPLSEEIA
jgi:hypothetical protein